MSLRRQSSPAPRRQSSPAPRRQSSPAPRRLWRRPAPTIRLRLALLYGAVFLVTGAVLLTIGYLLVRNGVRNHHQLAAVLKRLGRKPPHLDLLGRALGYPAGSAELRLAHAIQRQLINDALHRLLLEYIGALVAMTLVAIGTGYLLAGRALRPLRAITATARRVSGENLGERIALDGPADELRELADTFDSMLTRLDGVFSGQRHFVANASHELRTPLAIMRTEVDVALADPEASVPELRAMGEAVRETVDRCEQLIGSLLILARSEATASPGEPVDIAALAGDCITDLRAGARDARVEVRSELEPASTLGDPALLERLLANLLDNGIRHNQPGGLLEISTRVRGGRVELRVVNGGPRIESVDAEQLMQPFRRLDRSVAGFGLGLSIVRSVAEAHGGTAVASAPEGGGLEVLVKLPVLPESPTHAPPRRLPADPEPSLTES